MKLGVISERQHFTSTIMARLSALVLALLFVDACGLRAFAARSRPHQPLTRKPSWRCAPPTATVTPPRGGPGLPPPSEDGGPLRDLLPISLLLESQPADRSADVGVGEDAGAFAWNNERWGEVFGRDWVQFVVAVGSILSALVVLWILPSTGYADDFQAMLERNAGGNPHLVTLQFGLLFPLVHSGLASLRPYASQVTGERLWRVMCACASHSTRALA